VVRLIERDALLERLATAEREGGRVLFVGGEAGVGKTALVRAFTSGLDRRVLLGACEDLVTPAPLGPLADVAREIGRVLASDIEDVHWADEATLDVLRVVGRRIAATPSLVPIRPG
jgi:predicted ATPase